MNEWGTWLLPVLTFMFGIGGPAGVYVLLRKEMRQTPIEYNTAQVADAVAVSQTANALASTVMTRLAQQDQRSEAQDRQIGELRKESDAHRQRADELEERVEEVENKWGNWYVDLKIRWPFHRQQEEPPPPPN